jgi:hypothetical protein
MMALKTPSVPLEDPVREFAPKFLEALLVKKEKKGNYRVYRNERRRFEI